MPRLPEKKTKKIAEWQAYGTRLGNLKAEAHFKTLKAGKKVSQRAHIGRFIDAMLDKIDPLKLGSMLAVTYFIKNGIEWTEDIMAGFVAQKEQFPLFSFGWVAGHVWDYMGIERKADLPVVEVYQWGMSFAVAYLVIEHPEVVLNVAGGMLGFAKGFLRGVGI